MNYLIHNSVEQMLNEAMTPPDWDAALKAFGGKGKHYVNEEMESNWFNWTKGTPFSGKTERVIEECRGEHDDEAKLICETACEMMSDDFMKKRFSFQKKQVYGQMVDIPRYLSGDQRYWFATKKIRRISRAVRVYAPIGGLGCITAKQMAVCGALTSSVVEKLESEGINVELWASYHIHNFFHGGCNATTPSDTDWRKVCGLIKIKDSSEYSDLGLISYITGNRHFYRNIVFKSRVKFAYDMFMTTGVFSSCGGAYHSSDFLEEFILPDGEYTKENTIIIPRIYDMDEARQWFNNKFNSNNE